MNLFILHTIRYIFFGKLFNIIYWRVGSIQSVATGPSSKGMNQYIIVVCFDLYSVLLSFQHMHGPMALATMDATMIGETPRIQLSSSSSTSTLASTIVERNDTPYGYHTVLFWTLHDHNQCARSDSQSPVSLPTIEIHVYNCEKSGLPAPIIEQGCETAMGLLNGALKCAKKIIPPTDLPSKLYLMYMEMDNGSAERLAIANLFGNKCVLLKARWHTRQIAVDFISRGEREGIFLKTECEELMAFIRDYFSAKSYKSAIQSMHNFQEKLNSILRSKTSSAKAAVIEDCDVTVGAFLFTNPVEVCDYGRMKVQQHKMASGELAENVNRQTKHRIGYYYLTNVN